ncbi:MAG: oligoendopeptidase F [Anaerolineae bacterium]
MPSPSTVLKRSEVPSEHRWNAESVFATPAAWQEAFAAVDARLPELKAFEGHLGDAPAKLADYLETFESIFNAVGHVYFYAVMEQSCDSSNAAANSMAGQAGGLFGRLLAASAFADPELLVIGRQTLDRWIASEPRLGKLQHYVDNLFRKQEHVRSAEVEELLGALAEPFGQIDTTSEMLQSVELPFEPATPPSGELLPVTQGTIDALLSHSDRDARRSAWEHYRDGYLAFKETLASNLIAAMKRDVFYARARRYESSLEASLFENNVPPTVFYNLVDTFKKHIPTWHRYWAVRRKALGVDKLYPYDIWAPISTVQPVVEYGQAVDWISEGMKLLGEDYVRVLRKGCLEDRWVDIYPNVGKRQGAFSFGWKGTHPFIMHNYNDDLKSMSTLAHELGHSMHSYLTWQNQPTMYSNYSLFVAEVASNFNQALVRAHLMQANPDPEFQIALIEEAMNNFHRYFFIMPTLARFELEMHQRIEAGEGLTADAMNTRMLELYQEGYGSELDPDGPRTGITWATFGHLYANYYVFQYATGISAAHALAQHVLNHEPRAAERYLSMLKTGSSLYAIDALKLAGVDMQTPEAVETTFGVLAQYVDRLEELIDAREG